MYDSKQYSMCFEYLYAHVADFKASQTQEYTEYWGRFISANSEVGRGGIWASQTALNSHMKRAIGFWYSKCIVRSSNFTVLKPYFHSSQKLLASTE